MFQLALTGWLTDSPSQTHAVERERKKTQRLTYVRVVYCHCQAVVKDGLIRAFDEMVLRSERVEVRGCLDDVVAQGNLLEGDLVTSMLSSDRLTLSYPIDSMLSYPPNLT